MLRNSATLTTRVMLCAALLAGCDRGETSAQEHAYIEGVLAGISCLEQALARASIPDDAMRCIGDAAEKDGYPNAAARFYSRVAIGIHDDALEWD